LTEPNAKPGLLVWAAVDGQDPQLFATLVDQSGRRVAQKMLTRTPGEVSDVAVVRTDSGFLIAWVDGRTPSPEVFAVTVDERLGQVGKAQQLSHGSRAPADVALVEAFGGVTAVWSDARGAGSTGHAHLYWIRLDPADAHPLSVEQKLADSAGHAHGARLGLESEVQLAVCWIESRPGTTTDGGVARCARVDEQSQDARAFDLPTPPTAGDLSLFCDAGSCRVLVVASGGSGDGGLAEIWGVDLSSAALHRAGLLQPLWSDTSTGVVPVLLGQVGYFADRDPDTDGWLLERITIDWDAP
jgi:hypothetical protein